MKSDLSMVDNSRCSDNFVLVHQLSLFLSWITVSLISIICAKHFRIRCQNWYIFHISAAVYLCAISLLMPCLAIECSNEGASWHFGVGMAIMILCCQQTVAGCTFFFLRRAMILSEGLRKIFRICHAIEGYGLSYLALIQCHIGLITKTDANLLIWIYILAYIVYSLLLFNEPVRYGWCNSVVSP